MVRGRGLKTKPSGRLAMLECSAKSPMFMLLFTFVINLSEVTSSFAKAMF
jgi:hypothetical protein